MAPHLRLPFAALITLACFPAVGAWEVKFGNCTFRNGESGELLRFGYCFEQTGMLDLSNMDPKIRSLTPGVFDGMKGLS